MDTASLKKFAQNARRSLMDQVSNKLKAVLAPDSLARRESVVAVAHLESLIKEHSQEFVIERVAYIWFNRLSALRFMDVNHYNPVGIVSPVEGQSQPEILADAKAGHIDPELVLNNTRKKVNDLIANKIPSANPQAEAYRLLLVAACNYWNQAMPFLFEKIADYTELLMPDDLLSDQSILSQLRSSMTREDCADVEIIGWLYQFYISEKKDEVFEGLKRNKKIDPENIPAATQLFTPHWIVRYLVENSLGRLWMLNHPNSNIADRMDYYIKPKEQEKDFIKISNPEEIKICDPACGSGHMLVYAFDLFYAIYEEEGYDASDIPTKILTNNLCGIEIDERAGELAAFALMMKARARQRLFFKHQVQPNICVLENVKFDSGELIEYMSVIGRDLFTLQLQNTLRQFEDADNFGSLICPDLTDIEPMVRFLDVKNVGSDIFLNKTHQKVIRVLYQAEYLRPKYHIVIANPPYMSGSGMNNRLSNWIKDNYQDCKADLFAVFIERNLSLLCKSGFVAMITMQSWMFLSSFERMRMNIINNGTIISMAHLGARAFDSIGGEVVSTTAFIVMKKHYPNYEGSYFRLLEGANETEKSIMLAQAVQNSACPWFFRSTAGNFAKIPGSPIAYWASKKALNNFIKHNMLQSTAFPKQGSTIGDNEKFLRLWFELGRSDQNKWRKTIKGGDFRKWYGNNLFKVNWGSQGELIRLTGRATIRNYDYLFCEGIEWSRISSKLPAFRYLESGYFHESASGVAFPDSNLIGDILGLLNSYVTRYYLGMLNPTLTFQSGDISRIPYIEANSKKIVLQCINISRMDWDSNEYSWDFKKNPLLDPAFNSGKIECTYNSLRLYWKSMTNEMQKLEEENNSVFIKAYGLDSELTQEVPIEEITLSCNPCYRYSNGKSSEKLEVLLLADTIREFISYAVGCMFGRYSLDKPGLVLADQGDSITDYLVQIPSPTFIPDEDNVIPILDGDWFTDDIVERFRQFLRVTFGDENFQENLQFIEDAIGKDIRSFFLKDFYSDHIKRYKKRPIYWLFSSPKGTFNALIYMHRYRPDTVSIILNKYLREFKVKLSARMEYLNRIEVSTNASKSEKTRAIKERETLKKNLEELDTWERDVLYPLALEQKEIDLDDGVKVNYPKFGAALKRIPGLDAEED